MPNAGRNFSLTDRHQHFVDAQVSTGRHASGSEVVREALRRYEDDVAREQAYRNYLDTLIAQGEADLAQGRSTLVEPADLLDFVRKVARSPA